MNLFQLFKPKPVAATPVIETYGEAVNIDPQEIQAVMEWLFASLVNAQYSAKAYLIWYDDNNPNPGLEKVVKKLTNHQQPIFQYRCGNRSLPLPNSFYWRMMEEYPSMRVYQLEVKDE